MKRGHRKSHLLVWMLLGPLVLLGFYLGIAARSEMPTQASPVADEPPQSTPPATAVTDK